MDISVQRSQTTATHQNLLITKGALAILWGVAALLGVLISPMPLIIAFGILNFAAAGLTLLYAYNNRHLEIAHQWLLLEGLVELAAGVVFTFFVPDVQHFIMYMSYGIIFIITLQFIYGYTLLLMERFSARNMLMRFISVLAGTVIGVGLLANVFSIVASLVMVGIFSIIYGVLNMQFAMKLRNVVLGKAE
ncbi:MAG: hypothetical protein EOP49_46795 [Sphingobacteriales bacterium]|nr:MAG: hypothetical protein EOP49_46795 [Sphingobacteriales bacterium]